MTKVNCTHPKCRENGSVTGKKDGWEYSLCPDHAKKLRPMIEQTGPYKSKLKLGPPVKENHGPS